MKIALIISGGGFQGLTLIRALQQRDDVRVIVCDIYAENPTRYLCLDYRVAPSLSDEEAFSNFLLKTVESSRVDFVFPATARELRTLSGLRTQTEAFGAQVAVSDRSLLETLLDKLKAYEWLKTTALPVPEILDPADFAFDTPLFGRPREGWGGRDTIIADNADDAQTHKSEWSNYVWTRWLPEFEEFSLDFAIGVNRKISTITMRRRLRASGGFAVVSESVADTTLQHLADCVAQAIRNAGGRGLFNVQVLAPNKSEYFVSDINPRSGTSSTHSLAEGINLPGFFIDSAAAEAESEALPVRKMVRTARLLQDLSIPRLARTPKAVIFDLDDTLVDHKLWMLGKIEAIYAKCFANVVSESEFLLCAARLIDEGVRSDLIDRLFAELSLPSNLRNSVIQAYREATVSDTPLFSDVDPTLTALKEKGFLIAVVTDNPPSTQRSKVERAPILNRLDAIVYTREHGGEKPHERGFIQAAHLLSLEPSQLIMVGDSYFRDGVGAMRAGYLHALIVRRNGTFLNHHTGIANRLALNTAKHIDFVDSLTSVYHTCSFYE
jgi:FMN phosphatase YigB (HAD superfamily)